MHCAHESTRQARCFVIVNQRHQINSKLCEERFILFVIGCGMMGCGAISIVRRGLRNTTVTRITQIAGYVGAILAKAG